VVFARSGGAVTTATLTYLNRYPRTSRSPRAWVCSRVSAEGSIAHRIDTVSTDVGASCGALVSRHGERSTGRRDCAVSTPTTGPPRWRARQAARTSRQPRPRGRGRADRRSVGDRCARARRRRVRDHVRGRRDRARCGRARRREASASPRTGSAVACARRCRDRPSALGRRRPAAMAELVAAWATAASPLVRRAAVAAICEPRLLRSSSAAARAVEICRQATDTLRALPTPGRRDPDVRTLRQCLGYAGASPWPRTRPPDSARFTRCPAMTPTSPGSFARTVAEAPALSGGGDAASGAGVEREPARSAAGRGRLRVGAGRCGWPGVQRPIRRGAHGVGDLIPLGA
jgi:hypothetical protein